MTAKKAKPPVVPEKIEQARIVQLLRSLGASVYVLGHPSPSDGRAFRGTGQTPGIPDLYAFLPPLKFASPPHGVTLWVEVKRQGGAVRPAQRDFDAQCRAVWQPYVRGTLDDVRAWLTDEGYLR